VSPLRRQNPREEPSALARLQRFDGCSISKPLISLNRGEKVGTTSGRPGQSGRGLSALILGGGCGGRVSFIRCSRSF
jgi:hypothetical protein